MTVRLTERDRRMLVKCAVCRWLATDQVKRLYFAEATHAVGPKGKPLVEEKGVEVAGGGEVPRQVEHMQGVNEIRIAVETSGIKIVYFFAYWQLASLGWAHPVIPDAVFAVRTPEL